MLNFYLNCVVIKDSMFVFLKECIFITNYFSESNNKVLLLFSTDLLCGISVLAEQSASHSLIDVGFVHVVLKNNKTTIHSACWTRFVQDISCLCSALCRGRIRST